MAVHILELSLGNYKGTVLHTQFLAPFSSSVTEDCRKTVYAQAELLLFIFSCNAIISDSTIINCYLERWSVLLKYFDTIVNVNQIRLAVTQTSFFTKRLVKRIHAERKGKM